MSNKEDKKERFETDKDVEKMLKTWDMVKCKVCGKNISMLTAKQTKDGSGFMCKGH
jgi:hypothetical protein